MEPMRERLGARTQPCNCGEKRRIKGGGVWLWSLVFRSFGISRVLSRSVVASLFGWWNWFGKHSYSIWNLVSLCLMWCIWREQNWQTFEDMESSTDQLFASFNGSHFDWSRAWGLTSSESLPLFLISLLCNQFFFFFFVCNIWSALCSFRNIHLSYLSKKR